MTALARPASLAPVPPPLPLRFRSGSASVADFVEEHAPGATSDGLFVACDPSDAPGSPRPFEILLADGKPALGGIARVATVFRDGEGPGGRAGVILRFVELDAPSMRVHASLLHRAKLERHESQTLPADVGYRQMVHETSDPYEEMEVSDGVCGEVDSGAAGRETLWDGVPESTKVALSKRLEAAIARERHDAGSVPSNPLETVPETLIARLVDGAFAGAHFGGGQAVPEPEIAIPTAAIHAAFRPRPRRQWPTIALGLAVGIVLAAAWTDPTPSPPRVTVAAVDPSSPAPAPVADEPTPAAAELLPAPVAPAVAPDPTPAVVVTSSPPGATLLVNGRPAGQTPTRVSVRAGTRVRVALRMRGHHGWRRTVTVGNGPVDLHADLPRR